jgi:hypothetical protein
METDRSHGAGGPLRFTYCVRIVTSTGQAKSGGGITVVRHEDPNRVDVFSMSGPCVWRSAIMSETMRRASSDRKKWRDNKPGRARRAQSVAARSRMWRAFLTLPIHPCATRQRVRVSDFA